jgi:hypothetical protein
MTKIKRLHIKIDKPENDTILDEKINRATAKYENFQKSTWK